MHNIHGQKSQGFASNITGCHQWLSNCLQPSNHHFAFKRDLTRNAVMRIIDILSQISRNSHQNTSMNSSMTASTTGLTASLVELITVWGSGFKCLIHTLTLMQCRSQCHSTGGEENQSLREIYNPCGDRKVHIEQPA